LVVVHGISFLFYIGYLNVCKKDRRLVGYGRKGAYLVLCFRIKSQVDHKSVCHIRELNNPVVGMNFSVQKHDEVKKIFANYVDKGKEGEISGEFLISQLLVIG